MISSLPLCVRTGEEVTSEMLILVGPTAVKLVVSPTGYRYSVGFSYIGACIHDMCVQKLEMAHFFLSSEPAIEVIK